MKQIDSTSRARRAGRGLVLVMAILGLPACYEFPVPLDPEPRLKPDARLVGAWLCVPSEPTIPPDLRVRAREGELVMALKFEARNLRYGIRLVGMDKPDEEAAWEGFASELGERTVLNLRAISEKPEEDPKQVTLVSYTLLSKDVVQFDLIDDKPVKGKPLSPSSELRKTLLNHRPQSDLFSPFMVCVRAKIEDPS